jgi:ABC-type uncharacterized transport system YnjBCD substrate-binding protein
MVRLLQVAAKAVALAERLSATAQARTQRQAASGDPGTMDPLPGTALTASRAWRASSPVSEGRW